MQKKIGGLCGLAFVAILTTATPGFCASSPPSPPLGCVSVGDPEWEDVWHFCPSGKSSCLRWSGYGLFQGGWPSCYSFGEPPVSPYAWNAQAKAWTQDGKTVLKCTDIVCH